MRTPSSSVALLLMLVSGISTSFADERAHEGALCESASPPVTAARSALLVDSGSLAGRFKLADALIEANCYDAAVHTLEDGEAIHPRNAELQAKLRTTRSLVSEQDYFAGKEQAELAAKVSRNLLRCNKLGDLNACDEALKLKPNDAEILLSKGDALLKVSRPAEAVLAYRRARQAAPDNPRVAAQLAVAQAQRQSMVSACQKGNGDDSLQSCQGALLKGADDEFATQSRIALLYQQRNQPALALASYIAANALKPGDRGVAQGIVALTDANSQSDAAALAARSSALITLNRGRQLQRPEVSTVTASVPLAQVAQARLYSNAAEPSRTH